MSCAPILKYAGGKSWLAPSIVPILRQFLARVDGTYVEPFCGSAAVGLQLAWPRSLFADVNPDIIALYRALTGDAEAVITALAALTARGLTETVYYEARAEVNAPHRELLSSAELAARVLWLNKAGYNGLMRYSAKGRFNVPWGKRTSLALPSAAHLRRVGAQLRPAILQTANFATVLETTLLIAAPNRCAFFLDPPYVTAPDDARSGGFTSYAAQRYTWDDQKRLAKLAGRAAAQGALVIVTNAWAPEVCALYQAEGFRLAPAVVRHNIGATGARRGDRLELVAVSATCPPLTIVEIES